MLTLRDAMALLAASAALSACGTETRDAPAAQSQRPQTSRESAFGNLAEPIDRAAGVEQLQIDRKREIDEALER